MPRLRLRLGPLALGFALSLGRCGGGPPLMYAFADESEPALVLVDDGQNVDDAALEPEASEPETEASESEPEPKTEASEPGPEPEPEPEPLDRDTQIQQTATTEDVLEHIDAATERLDALVDLMMIVPGCMGVFLGTIAFGKVWGPLAGER